MTPSVSLQLYSVRHALERDVAGTVARIAQAGFTHVEASQKLLTAHPSLLAELRSHELRMPTLTGTLVDVDRAGVFELALELGSSIVVDTLLPEPAWREQSLVEHSAEQFAKAAEEAAMHGLSVAYHNHWWEFEHNVEGVTAYDFFVDRLPAEVLLEIDAYWSAVGGVDPVQLVGRLKDRVRLLHLKDGPISRDNSQQRPVGEGRMPISELLGAAPNLEAAVVEFDDFDGDIFDAIERSRRALSGMVAA